MRDLKKNLDVYRELDDVFIHYSGHSTIRIHKEMARDAGQWCCGAGELLPIEDLISKINE